MSGLSSILGQLILGEDVLGSVPASALITPGQAVNLRQYNPTISVGISVAVPIQRVQLSQSQTVFGRQTVTLRQHRLYIGSIVASQSIHISQLPVTVAGHVSQNVYPTIQYLSLRQPSPSSYRMVLTRQLVKSYQRQPFIGTITSGQSVSLSQPSVIAGQFSTTVQRLHLRQPDATVTGTQNTSLSLQVMTVSQYDVGGAVVFVPGQLIRVGQGAVSAGPVAPPRSVPMSVGFGVQGYQPIHFLVDFYLVHNDHPITINQTAFVSQTGKRHIPQYGRLAGAVTMSREIPQGICFVPPVRRTIPQYVAASPTMTLTVPQVMVYQLQRIVSFRIPQSVGLMPIVTGTRTISMAMVLSSTTSIPIPNWVKLTNVHYISQTVQFPVTSRIWVGMRGLILKTRSQIVPQYVMSGVINGTKRIPQSATFAWNMRIVPGLVGFGLTTKHTVPQSVGLVSRRTIANQVILRQSSLRRTLRQRALFGGPSLTWVIVGPTVSAQPSPKVSPSPGLEPSTKVAVGGR